MPLAKILVSLDGSDRDTCALTTAVRAAKPFAAHVAALFAHADAAEGLPSFGMPLPPDVMGALIDGNIKLSQAVAKQMQETIARVCKDEGARAVSVPCRDERVTISFHEAIGYPPRQIEKEALLSDLAVCAPWAGLSGEFEIAIDLILHGRRPVLLAAKPPQQFRKIMIGWNNTVPAAHGVCAAMPFLEKADSIELVCLQQSRAPDFGTGAVTAYLKAHGLECSEVHLRILDSVVYRSLAQFACEKRADLLVLGGFSHSRVRETLFGGVTNEFLRDPPLPVLLAH